MDSPLIIAKLWRGYPADLFNLDTLEAPYDEAARQMLAPTVKDRHHALMHWLESIPDDDVRVEISQTILVAAASLEPKENEAQPKPGAELRYHDQVKSLADTLTSLEQLPDVVEGVLPARSLTILYGPPGSLKTNIALDMGMAVATGCPWLPGLPGTGNEAGSVVSRQPVLWVDVDSGQDVLQERIAAFSRAYRASPDAPFYWLTFPTPPIQASKGLDDIIKLAKHLKAGLIGMDNLLRIAGVRDENSSEMDAVMTSLRRLAEDTGAAVLVLHHRRKQGQGERAGDTMRGHSSIEAAIDAGLLVERTDDLVTVRCTKARRKPIADFSARWTYEHQADDKTLQTARFFREPLEAPKDNAEALLRQRILTVLGQANRLLNQSELVEAVRGRRKAVIAMLEVLEEDGLIDKSDGPHNSKLYTLKLH